MYHIIISDEKWVTEVAQDCNIDFVMVDLETKGKVERQKGLDAHFTTHNIDSVARVRKYLRSNSHTKLLVRCNPLSASSEEEINLILNHGADRVMLPMYRTADDVRNFKKIISGRVPIVLLAETRDALKNMESVIPLLSEEDIIHFGLNDLSLEFGFDFLFDILKAKLLDGPCALCVDNNIRFGIGGVGNPLVHSKVSPKYILDEHARLKAGGVILSRAFRNNCIIDGEFCKSTFSSALDALNEIERKSLGI